MERKGLSRLVGYTAIVLVVLSMLLAACAQPAPAPGTAPTVTVTAKPAPAPTVTVTAKPAPAPTVTVTAPAQQEVITWRFQTTFTPGTGGWNIHAEFADRIKRASSGRFNIELLAAGSVLPAKEILQGLRDGVVEMGAITPSYYSGILPEGPLMGAPLPGLLRGWDDVMALLYDFDYINLHREIYKDYNIYYIASRGSGGHTMWANKPVSTLADFKGLKVRTFGDFAQMFEALGASPVFIPHEESYTALALGTVDAYATAHWIYEDYKHYEICPYMMVPSFAAVTFASSVDANMDAWNKLPDDLKALVQMSADLQLHEMLYADASQSELFRRVDRIRALGYPVETVQFSEEVQGIMAKSGIAILDEKAKVSPRAAQYAQGIKDLMKLKGYIE